MKKICPIWSDAENEVECQEDCAWLLDGKCALVVIAEAVTYEREDGRGLRVASNPEPETKLLSGKKRADRNMAVNPEPGMRNMKGVVALVCAELDVGLDVIHDTKFRGRCVFARRLASKLGQTIGEKHAVIATALGSAYPSSAAMWARDFDVMENSPAAKEMYEKLLEKLNNTTEEITRA